MFKKEYRVKSDKIIALCFSCRISRPFIAFSDLDGLALPISGLIWPFYGLIWPFYVLIWPFMAVLLSFTVF